MINSPIVINSLSERIDIVGAYLHLYLHGHSLND